MSLLDECLEELNVPREFDIDMLSYSEKEIYRICVGLVLGKKIVVDASVFDDERLMKIINYLRRKGARFDIKNLREEP